MIIPSIKESVVSTVTLAVSARFKKPGLRLLVMLPIALSLFANTSAVAQQCNLSSITASNDNLQFVIDIENGTVIDVKTGLEWSMCSLGQSYQNGNCLGAPQHYSDYDTAVIDVNNITMSGSSWQGYRLPNIKELGSIVERSCNEPAISLTTFKGTLNAVYYSSTPDNLGNQHFSPLLGVKVIDFTNGSEFIPDVSKYRYVRLVRTIDGK